MGVTGLWNILEPAHRPVKLETLAKKRLAIDASIWIYQFLKAVRDKEGNALRNSHIVGFFRRICKLLFHGVRPVFVFDGGAPALKRQTIAGRKSRREGRKEDAARTAGKLLALQVKRRAEEEAERRRNPHNAEDEAMPEDMVYVDELLLTPQQRKQKRGFKPTDQYHLPELEHELSELGVPNDVRIMSQEEIQEYARQFEGMEDFNLYDFSNMDFSSPFFASLPEADRYRILNAARLRSRLRMGYTKEQLDKLFPDRMAFSRFQIERVARRNELSQRVMNIQGWDDAKGVMDISRVAGEKGREYALVRNEGEHGGWALSFVGNKDSTEGDRNKPIVLDSTQKPREEDDKEVDEEEEFEDIPIEGLNRLPKPDPSFRNTGLSLSFENEEAEMLRKALYESRLEESGGAKKPHKPKNMNNSKDRLRQHNPLFLGDEVEDLDDTLIPMETEGPQHISDSENEELRRAITLSYEGVRQRQPSPDDEDEELQRAIALSRHHDHTSDIMNGKGKSREIPGPRLENNEDGDYRDAIAASMESHQSKPGDFNLSGESSKATANHAPPFENLGLEKTSSHERSDRSGNVIRKYPLSNFSPQASSKPPSNSAPRFNGLDLSGSSSFLFKKKPALEDSRVSMMDKLKAKDHAVERENGPLKEVEEEKSIPLPPWFAGGATQNLQENMERVRERQNKDAEEYNKSLEATNKKDIISIESSDDSELEMLDIDTGVEKPEISMGDIADRLKEAPPKQLPENHSESAKNGNTGHVKLSMSRTVPANEGSEEELEWEESDDGIDISRKPGAKPTQVSSLGLAPSSLAHTLDSPPSATVDGPDDLDFDLDFDLFDAPSPPLEVIDQEDIDEQQLLVQMAREEEEHARFAAELNPEQSREQAMDEYERELKSLRSQQKKDRRDADEVTQVMIQECQQLLKLFGLPYVTAPMEAEAQCAELVRLNLVDGIVTDDSDVFLFGGTRVYRYMFNDKQVVQCYLTSDLEAEFGLDRKRLISAAHLLGSDYTEGIPNVGPVTAVELLAEFKDDGGLMGFKEWWTRVQQGREKPEESKTNFRRKFRKNADKIFLPPIFPDPRVDEAYLKPEVDSDPSAFEWGVPDLDGLRAFLMSTVGWGKERTDQVLVPVVRDMNLKVLEGTQRNITSFFGEGAGAGAFAPRQKIAISGRMQKALGRIKEGGMDAPGEAASAAPMSMREAAKRRKKAISKEAEDSDDSASVGEVEKLAPMSMREAAKRRAGLEARNKDKDELEISSLKSSTSMNRGTKRRKRTTRATSTASASAEAEESEADVEDEPVKKKRGTKKTRGSGGRGGRGGKVSARKRGRA